MLFPDVERDIRIATRGMSHFEFFTRCLRSECAVVRDLLEDWYRNYPQEERQELKARFRADNNHFSSVFWELYLHELLIRLGYSVEVHPKLTRNEDTQPDFLAVSPEGEEVIIEAVSPAKQSEEELATINRKRTVLDTIDKLENPDFYVAFSEEGGPTKSPSGRKIRSVLKRWLGELDYDSCKALLEEGRFGELPTRAFEVSGWKLEFQVFPKSDKCRGKPSDRLIHMHRNEVQWIDSRTPIRDAIRRKVSRYGDVDRPYIVAVNPRDEFIDDIDIGEALFGKEVIVCKVGAGQGMQGRLARRPDGVWTNEAGERNTRVSAVLLGINLFPSNVAKKPLALYHNPWAQRKYNGRLSTLRQFVPSNEMLAEVEGIHSREVFGLDENWPHSAV